jgi:hypothetical protein
VLCVMCHAIRAAGSYGLLILGGLIIPFLFPPSLLLSEDPVGTMKRRYLFRTVRMMDYCFFIVIMDCCG